MIAFLLGIIVAETFLLTGAYWKLKIYERLFKEAFKILESQQNTIRTLDAKVRAMKDVYGKYSKN